MVYSNNQRVITLDEYGLSEFRRELIRLRKENYIYDRKNRDWFNHLPDTFLDYEQWFFFFKGEDPVSFSTIQKYYEGCYRILTRTYVYRNYRRFVSPKEDKIISPTVPILSSQLEYIKETGGYETMFVSTQGLQSRNALLRWKVKAEHYSGSQWYFLDGMGQTCSDPDNKECFQNILYTGSKPKINIMSYEEYRTRWTTKR